MENEQVTPQTAEQPTAQTTEQPKSEAKEKAMAAIKPILELNEPIFFPKFAEKLGKRLSLIYLVGLVVLTLTLLSSLVSIFYTPIIGFCNLVMTAVWFIVFRMFCEALLPYKPVSTETPATETTIEAPEAPKM